MSRQTERKTVLVLQRSILKRDRDEMSGIAVYARDADWSVQTVEYGTAAVNRFHCSLGEDRRNIRSLLKFWHPAGCIVECGGEPPDIMPRLFGNVPVVFLDCPPSIHGRRVSCVSSDARSIAEQAVRVLLPLGFENYAFVSWPKETLWSRERGESFADFVVQNGKTFRCFNPPSDRGLQEWRRRLDAWIATLPKPCGVLAANDWCAEQIVGICASRNIAVPCEIAVVGVDNDTDICENAAVSISSITTDNVRAGELAAMLLAEQMKCGNPPCRTALFGATGFVQRASTRMFRIADSRVAKAIEHIRRHACDRLESGDVAGIMGCSRRWAEIRFREVAGHSILDEIHDVRFARALELMPRHGFRLEDIANACGYESASFFRKHFKKRMGCSPREWRKTNA